MNIQEWEKNRLNFAKPKWLEEKGKELAAEHDMATIEKKFKDHTQGFKSLTTLFDRKNREYMLNMSMLWGSAKLAKEADERGAQ